MPALLAAGSKIRRGILCIGKKTIWDSFSEQTNADTKTNGTLNRILGFTVSVQGLLGEYSQNRPLW